MRKRLHERSDESPRDRLHLTSRKHFPRDASLQTQETRHAGTFFLFRSPIKTKQRPNLHRRKQTTAVQMRESSGMEISHVCKINKQANRMAFSLWLRGCCFFLLFRSRCGKSVYLSFFENCLFFFLQACGVKEVISLFAFSCFQCRVCWERNGQWADSLTISYEKHRSRDPSLFMVSISKIRPP